MTGQSDDNDDDQVYYLKTLGKNTAGVDSRFVLYCIW